ncbi:hypothetical protein [Streptomyces sp. NBC_01190]|uniref:hypothetical protein n=1 Tax=Streptomyces sp. NBC_01190 TaxID=2903767 RepID=UPI003868358B|nr:hypothetical protein OG519_28340 [Streptomyces sp. NBC_01190]
MNQLPSVERLAGTAQECLTLWKADSAWPTLTAAALVHLHRWSALVGITTIDRLDLATDARPLLVEAGRVLAINASAGLTSGQDLAASLPVPGPVAEAVYALMAQVTELRGITGRSGVRIIHHTPDHALPYEPGCLTHQVYNATWGPPPERYWLSHQTFTARQRELREQYAEIGLTLHGHRHTFSRTA